MLNKRGPERRFVDAMAAQSQRASALSINSFVLAMQFSIENTNCVFGSKDIYIYIYIYM